MWNLKNKINEQIKQKQTYRYREHFDDCQMERQFGEMGGKGERINMYKLLIIKTVTEM